MEVTVNLDKPTVASTDVVTFTLQDESLVVDLNVFIPLCVWKEYDKIEIIRIMRCVKFKHSTQEAAHTPSLRICKYTVDWIFERFQMGAPRF